VIDVAIIGLIRRWHIRDQLSLREISRRLGISRNTVRRYIRSGTIEPVYADRQSPSSLDKYAFKLSTWLKTESTKSRKQKRSVKQMHLDLRELGYEGSYDRVAAFARQWKVDQLERVNSASKGTWCSKNTQVAMLQYERAATLNHPYLIFRTDKVKTIER
jgi:AraC-like DNA-binding protein